MLERAARALRQIPRIRKNVIPDIMDNMPSRKAPPTVEKNFESVSEASPVLERLCPHEARQALRSLTSEFEEGATYRARTTVGSLEDGTKHPHDFVLEKHGGDLCLYFVDPEHFVGERNLRRPSISNLMALRLPVGGSEPSVAVARFRTQTIAATDIAELKMERQLAHARQLIDNDGLPEPLRSHERDVLFRLLATPQRALLQSRYVGTSFGMELLLEGARSAPVLEGKVDSQRAIIESFLQLLRAGEFKSVTEKRAKREDSDLQMAA